MSYPRKFYDWPKLKAEFLASKESAAQFMVRKRLGSGFYKHGGTWTAERAEILKAAEAKMGLKLTDALVERWSRYRVLLDDCLTQAQGLAKKKKPSASQLNQLANAIDRLLKSDSLLHGQPTEIVKGTGPAHVTHQMLVDLIKAVEAKDPRVVLPETIIDAVIVDGPENDI